MTPEEEKKWREDSLEEFKNYMNIDNVDEPSEVHKEYLLKIADMCKEIRSVFKYEVKVVSGVSFMAGYLVACKAVHIEHKKQLKERDDLIKEALPHLSECDDECHANGKCSKSCKNRGMIAEKARKLVGETCQTK